ncbi:MAG: aldehyde dehydrogenase family protein [Myxococcales bacterium]|nr:aldehyde dehydrogenase family protein [Myxococcales bacterium]MCB9580695.1 aldehyde dehydrogenase family protein [Polyangiaceae bacterium]
MQKFDQIYVGGEWTQASGDEHFEVVNASTEEVMGHVPAATAADVDRAVERAAQAFPAWSEAPVEERAAALERIADGLGARQEELAKTIAAEVGMPIKLAGAIQAGLPTMVLRSFAQIARDFSFSETVGNSEIVREAVGVVGCITPWNYPLHQVIAKIAPALAAGCTVVLKPSEVAPLSAFILAEVIHAAKLPPGVFNLVSGDGPTVGEAIASHPKVDMVSFTGSTRAGKRVAELASQGVKRVALELGGKSANVILDDADFEKAVKAGVNNCYLNSGQTCSAWTRMLVPRDKLQEAAALAKTAAEKFTLGNAVEGSGRLGPLVSAAQRARVRDYIQKGVAEGATLVTGGAEQPADQPKGFFVKPTVFSDVKNDMTIAQEEIFGPVLCIIPYDSEDDAVRIANDTVYGLAGAVWSKDPERAKRVARRLRTGQVDINGGSFNPLAPFGGYKQSGLGREFGHQGLEEFLETKSLQL